MAILISFLLIIVFCTIIFLIIVFEKNKDKEYLDYVVKNSISLCELYDLNKQFKFCDLIEDMEESHSYDNEKFFENISCEDYLIYQLQLKKYDVEKDIKNVEYNKRIYEKYIEEVAKITEFGRYKSENPKLKKTTLQTIEQKLFGENILKPKMKYVAHVILYCSKINGAVYKRTCRDFEEEKIKNLIKRLNHIQHIRRTVTTWEHCNNLWFNGSENDVYSFKDLVDYCNELHFNETPLDIIREGVFLPIGGSAIAPYDLREYLYLPSSLIEEDEDIKVIREAFRGLGEDILQL